MPLSEMCLIDDLRSAPPEASRARGGDRMKAAPPVGLGFRRGRSPRLGLGGVGRGDRRLAQGAGRAPRPATGTRAGFVRCKLTSQGPNFAPPRKSAGLFRTGSWT